MISWLSVSKVKGDIYRYLSLKFYFLYLLKKNDLKFVFIVFNS